MQLIIDGKKAVLPKSFSFDYVSENRSFTDADDYTLSINLPLADCPQNREIFGHLDRMDKGSRDIVLDASIIDIGFFKNGVVSVVEASEVEVKVQFLEGRSAQNFLTVFDEVYINEINLGSLARLIQPPLNELRSIDAGNQYIALPWIYDGQPQNEIVFDADNNMQWSSETNKLSYQPYLIYVAKRICSALGYSFDFSQWENSSERYLIVCNTLPAEWNMPQLARVLPHWSVTKFFEELEKILVCEFNINHRDQHIKMIMVDDVEWRENEVKINNILDSFSVAVTHDDQLCEFKGNANIRYKGRDDIRWKLDNCKWYVDQMSDWGVRYLELQSSDDLAIWVHDHYDMLHQGLQKDIVRDSDAGYLIHIIESDRYFLYVVKQGYHSLYYYVQTEINRFGDLIYNPNSNDFIEIEMSPALIEESPEGIKCLSMLPSDLNEQEAADDEGILQPTAYAIFLLGEAKGAIEIYDSIYLAYWDGRSSNAGIGVPPAPFVDSRFSLQNRYRNYYSGIKIESKERLKVSWISSKIPDVRSVFHIRGRRYLCEKITATFTEDGMSQLLKGEFFAITD